MSTRWQTLEEFVEHGWSPEREQAVLASAITPEKVEANLDLLVRASWLRPGAAERLLPFALQVLDQASEVAIELRNQLGLHALDRGDYATALIILGNARDAAHRGSPWTDVITRNLAATALAAGDLTGARQWLASEPAEPDTEVGAAALRTAEAKLRGRQDDLRRAFRRLREVESRYRATTAPGAPTALVARAAVAAAEFELAMAQGDVGQAEEVAEDLELARQRIAAALGADHPDTLAVRLNLAVADFALARHSRSADHTGHALVPLAAAAEHLVVALGSSHPLALAAMCNLASARFEHARLVRSVQTASSALSSLRTAADAIARHLGARHPQALAAVANLATATLELARIEETDVDPSTALVTLETAYERATAVLGPDHATTRVLRQGLLVCRRWTDEQGGRSGALRTLQRIATDAAFGEEYVSFERARELLDAPRRPPSRRPTSRMVAQLLHAKLVGRSDETPLSAVEAVRRLEAALAELTERDRMIMEMFYFDDLMHPEIGRRLGMNTSRVAQEHKRALDRLTAALHRQQ